MAVPFYLPEGGADDIASSSSNASGSSSSGASSSASSDGASSVASQSPNTTTSATQTPMQSPMPMPADQVLLALCEWFHQRQRYFNVNTSAPQIFQYPPPPSPSCSMPQSPSYPGGDFFFPHAPGAGPGANQPPHTPHTSHSFAAGEEFNFFRQQPHPPPPSTPQPMPVAPQSAPPLHYSHSYPQQSPHLLQHHPAAFAGGYYATYTPPPTPNTANAGSSTSSGFGWHAAPTLAFTSTPLPSGSSSSGAKMRLQRSQSDAARRKRLTSTGEDEREYQSDHEASWDESDERYRNFTAGRERLQEFSGRIPPRKKKSSDFSSSISRGSSNSNSSCDGSSHSQQHQQTHQQYQEQQQRQAQQKKKQSFTWPTVVTVFVLAMGCGFFAAR